MLYQVWYVACHVSYINANFYTVTNFHVVKFGQFWASGQYVHSEINPQGRHNGVLNSTLIKYRPKQEARENKPKKDWKL